MQRARRISLAPTRIANGLIGVIITPLTADQHDWIVGIRCDIAHVEPCQPVQHFRNGEMDFAVARADQPPQILMLFMCEDNPPMAARSTPETGPRQMQGIRLQTLRQ
jgi:hypothetical protein